jgi:hypothetical protein
MKYKLIMSLVLLTGFMSTAVAKDTTLLKPVSKGLSQCITSVGTYNSDHSSIYDSIETSSIQVPTDLGIDRSLKVEVSFSKTICGKENISRFQALGAGLPNPDLGEPGDTRTVKQTRGGIEYTYKQTYIDGLGWVTTEMTMKLVELPEPDIEP